MGKLTSILTLAGIFAFLAGGVAFLVTVEMLFNDGYLFSLKVLAPSVAVLLAAAAYRGQRSLADAMHAIGAGKLIFLGLLGYVVLVFLSIPYVMLANALTASGATVTYEGPVICKFISGGKSRSYVLRVLDQHTQAAVEITVLKAEYEQVPVGASYRHCMEIGGLGLPFRWRYGEASTLACNRGSKIAANPTAPH